MNKRSIKFAILSLELLGVVIAIIAIAGCYLFWRLENHALQLSWIEGWVISAIENQLPDGHEASVANIVLSKDKQDGAYNIVLDNLRVSDGEGHEMLDLDSVSLNFTSGELFSTRLRPHRIILDRMTIDLVRRANRRLRLDYGCLLYTSPSPRDS